MDVDDRLGRKLRPTINTSLDIPVLLIRRTRVLADAFNTAARLHLRRAAVMICSKLDKVREPGGGFWILYGTYPSTFNGTKRI